MRRLGGALALLVAAGAAGGAAADDPPASATNANLFVYRDAARPADCAAQLLLDGVKFAALPQKSYTSIAVRPGVHQLEFRWAEGCGHGDVTDQVEVENRRLYYFALQGDAQVTPLGRYTTNLHETTSLVRVDPDQGVQTVGACCRFVPAFGRF